MRKKFISVMSLLIILTLLFTGCSKVGAKSRSLKGGVNSKQASKTSNTNSDSLTKKDTKDISDENLIDLSKEDSNVQLDSLDNELQQLSSEEIDSLLDENKDLKNIQSNFSVK